MTNASLTETHAEGKDNMYFIQQVCSTKYIGKNCLSRPIQDKPVLGEGKTGHASSFRTNGVNTLRFHIFTVVNKSWEMLNTDNFHSSDIVLHFLSTIHYFRNLKRITNERSTMYNF